MFLCYNQWKRFQYFNLETDFLQTENLFLVESTSFPYKTTISEANFKTIGMETTKWTYHKERSFASNYFIFLKILFQFKSLL